MTASRVAALAWQWGCQEELFFFPTDINLRNRINNASSSQDYSITDTMKRQGAQLLTVRYASLFSFALYNTARIQCDEIICD